MSQAQFANSPSAYLCERSAALVRSHSSGPEPPRFSPSSRNWGAPPNESLAPGSAAFAGIAPLSQCRPANPASEFRNRFVFLLQSQAHPLSDYHWLHFQMKTRDHGRQRKNSTSIGRWSIKSYESKAKGKIKGEHVCRGKSKQQSAFIQASYFEPWGNVDQTCLRSS